MIDRAAIASLQQRLGRRIAERASLPTKERDVELAYLAGNAWRYAALLERLPRACRRPLAGAAVVDIGAYPGHLAALFARDLGAQVTAVTLVATPAFEAEMQGAGVRIACCDVERDPLPAADRSIDVVVCCELIEHLDGDVEHVLREVRRVLSPDGVFILTTPNHAAASRRFALLRGRSVYPPLDDPVYPFYAGAGVRNPWRHVREFTIAEIGALLARAGFPQVEVDTASPPFGGRDGLGLRGYLSSRVIQAGERWLPGCGATIVATARG